MHTQLILGYEKPFSRDCDNVRVGIILSQIQYHLEYHRQRYDCLLKVTPKSWLPLRNQLNYVFEYSYLALSFYTIPMIYSISTFSYPFLIILKVFFISCKSFRTSSNSERVGIFNKVRFFSTILLM